MKVLVAELSQESNSFCPTRTTLDDFRQYGILSGEDYREAVRGIRIESEGIFTALEENGISYDPVIRMRAQAGPITLPEVYNQHRQGRKGTRTVRRGSAFAARSLPEHRA